MGRRVTVDGLPSNSELNGAKGLLSLLCSALLRRLQRQGGPLQCEARQHRQNHGAEAGKCARRQPIACRRLAEGGGGGGMPGFGGKPGMGGMPGSMDGRHEERRAS